VNSQIALSHHAPLDLFGSRDAVESQNHAGHLTSPTLEHGRRLLVNTLPPLAILLNLTSSGLRLTTHQASPLNSCAEE